MTPSNTCARRGALGVATRTIAQGAVVTARVPGHIATFRSDGSRGPGTRLADEVAFALPSPDGAIFPGPSGTQLCRVPTFDQCRTLRLRAGPLSPDGRTVFAIDRGDPRNLIPQPIDGGPTPLTNLTDMIIEDFSLSPDGRRIAVNRAARETDVVLTKGLQ